MKAQVDMLTYDGQGMQAHGSLAGAFLRSGLEVNSLRNNDVLGYDEWKHFDDIVIKEARQRTQGIEILQRRNLVYGGFNGMSATVLAYQDLNDAFDAVMDMDGRGQGDRDRPVTGINYLPLPIIHADFWFSVRELNMSRNGIAPLDTTSVEMATRAVIEKAEEILFQGASSYAYGGGTIYGLTDYTNRNQYTISTAWDASAIDENAKIVADDVRGMKQMALDHRMFGPYGLFVPANWETVLDNDYQHQSGWHGGKTIADRIQQIRGIEELIVADFLTDSNVVLTQLSPDVVRLVEGLSPTVVQWKTEGNMVVNFKVMAIWVPQIRATQGSRCGVVHGS
jgi:uncharacterized linocin/CFP29 family protein